MNRRGFISLLAGAAGAAFVPWRGHIERLITLPSREILVAGNGAPHTYRWSWDQGEGIETLAEGPRVILPAAGSDGVLWLAVTDGRGRTVRQSYHVRTEILTA